MTPEQVTAAYKRHGLPLTMSMRERAAWNAWLAGEGAPLDHLPKSGGTCYAVTHGGGPYCGFPLLIDGSCVNASAHIEVPIMSVLPEPPEYWGGESAPADRWGTQPRRGEAVRIVHELTGDGTLASRVVDALLAAGLIVEPPRD